jgi:hypothetical protein
LGCTDGTLLCTESRPTCSHEGPHRVLDRIGGLVEDLCRSQQRGIAAVNVVVTLHPDLIVLGGGVAQMGELLRAPVERTIRQRVGMFPTDGVRVALSQLGDQAGILGVTRFGCTRTAEILDECRFRMGPTSGPEAKT